MDDGVCSFWAGVILSSLIWLIFTLSGYWRLDDSWKKQITAHGYGGFWLDGNNVKQWDWAKPEKK
jgi:hypothetical protein